MDNKLAGRVYEVDKTATTTELWKYDNLPRAQTMPEGGGELVVIDPPKIQTVKLRQLGFQIDIKQWTKDPQKVLDLEGWMYRRGAFVAEREAWHACRARKDYI